MKYILIAFLALFIVACGDKESVAQASPKTLDGKFCGGIIRECFQFNADGTAYNLNHLDMPMKYTIDGAKILFKGVIFGSVEGPEAIKLSGEYYIKTK